MHTFTFSTHVKFWIFVCDTPEAIADSVLTIAFEMGCGNYMLVLNPIYI